MKKIILLAVSVFSQFAFVKCSAENNTSNYINLDTIYIATWNVENLFDTIDDPNTKDEEYTPGGERNWDEERLNQKLKNLSKTIKYMNNGKGPDLLAVQEVEHQSLLEKLNNEYLSEKKYGIIYGESLDKRGIDNGLFYSSSLFEKISFDTLRVDLPDGWLTRYILYAQLRIKGTENILHVFVNHWPSRSGGKEKSEKNRIAAANVLKNFTGQIFSENKKSNVIIMGDFNDEPTDTSVYEVLKAEELFCTGTYNGLLYNTSITAFKNGIGSYLYRGTWNMLDQIIISKALVEENKFNYVCNSFEIVKPDFMINKEGNYAGSSIRTFGGKQYIGGYSDHFPAAAKLTYVK